MSNPSPNLRVRNQPGAGTAKPCDHLAAIASAERSLSEAEAPATAGTNDIPPNPTCCLDPAPAHAKAPPAETVALIVGALQGLGHRCRPPVVRGNTPWTETTCPNHHDRNASLGIGEGDKAVIIQCAAGCEDVAVVSKLGLLDRLERGPRGGWFDQAGAGDS